ncbi:MAG: preprotein translocase subunit SecY [Marinifilaceae bacterium]|jgi:preprotein translocase subunit SecY|nr:preprotein translocase subunit SecY [Marinilabiliaceae bacterium JC040]MCT4600694.1 preprotein translocase subunit SecY [Marinifilaceae bacterium]
MKLVDTLKNIWTIKDLKERILLTLGLVLVYRFGIEIVLPGVDPAQLQGLEHQTKDGLLGLLDMFSGGAFSKASIFALGIMPYISASIVIQLLGMAVPYFQKLQREGESGHRKINQITRYLTVVILILQGYAYLTNLHVQLPEQAFVLTGFYFTFSSIAILTAGSMFVMWLGERITDKGIGNGISIIIMIGIIARLPFSFFAEISSKVSTGSGGGFMALILELIILFLVFAGTILLVQGTRKVPVQYAKRIVGNKQYGGVRQYIPLKINAAGVMPIIFAQAIMFVPMAFMNFASSEEMTGIMAALSNYQGFWYNFIFFLMIVLFTYIYTAITVNPTQMAEDMKKNGGFIPGVKPGKKTRDFLDAVMSRITLPGSIFLGIVAILPAFAMIAGVNNQFAHFYGGTSLLILVGVVLDTLQQIESHLLMSHYDGLMKSGRIKGKTPGGPAAY